MPAHPAASQLAPLIIVGKRAIKRGLISSSSIWKINIILGYLLLIKPRLRAYPQCRPCLLVCFCFQVLYKEAMNYIFLTNGKRYINKIMLLLFLTLVAVPLTFASVTLRMKKTKTVGFIDNIFY